MSTWTKSAAEAIGINTDKIKISNHSHRASTITHLAQAGVQEQTLIKMSGHSSSLSLKPYLQFDKEHHSTLVQEIRTNTVANVVPSDVQTNPATSNEVFGGRPQSVYNNCSIYISNCTNSRFF